MRPSTRAFVEGCGDCRAGSTPFAAHNRRPATIWIPTIGIVAQTLEGVAVWQSEALADQPQFALALWGISNSLWSATLVPFSTLIFAFSLAGRAIGAFPRGLVVLGLAASGSGFVGAFLSAAMAGEGWAVPQYIFFVLVLPWVVITSARMVRTRRVRTRHGSSQLPHLSRKPSDIRLEQSRH